MSGSSNDRNKLNQCRIIQRHPAADRIRGHFDTLDAPLLPNAIIIFDSTTKHWTPSRARGQKMNGFTIEIVIAKKSPKGETHAVQLKPDTVGDFNKSFCEY